MTSFSFSIARIERISYKITENYQKWVDVANSLRYNECSDQATMNKKEDTIMKEQSFITAKELAEMLNISTGHAYKVIHRLNDELHRRGI